MSKSTADIMSAARAKQDDALEDAYGKALIGMEDFFQSSVSRPARVQLFEFLAEGFADPAEVLTWFNARFGAHQAPQSAAAIAAGNGGQPLSNQDAAELQRLRAVEQQWQADRRVIDTLMGDLGVGATDSNQPLNLGVLRAAVNAKVSDELRGNDVIPKADVKLQIDTVLAKATEADAKATEADGKSDGHLESGLFRGGAVTKEDVKTATEAAKTAAADTKTATEAAKTALGL